MEGGRKPNGSMIRHALSGMRPCLLYLRELPFLVLWRGRLGRMREKGSGKKKKKVRSQAQAPFVCERRRRGFFFFDFFHSSLTHRGQLLRVRSHFEIQSRWKTCPQFPHAMLSPSSHAEEGFAWYSMLGSCKLLRQMAHVSVQMDHDQTATAFHCEYERHAVGSKSESASSS